MKYRIDFVTNSSSSSSVVVTIKTKTSDYTINYSLDHYTEGLNAIEPKYDQIIQALITARQIEIINKFDLLFKVPKLVEISGLQSVYIFEKEIENYIQNNPTDPLSEALKHIVKLDDIYDSEQVSTYNDFLNSSLWELLNIQDPKSITMIEEKFGSYGGYEQKNVTKIDPVRLKIKKK